MDAWFSRVVWWMFAFIFGITPLLFYPLLKFFPIPNFILQIDPLFTELFEVPKMFWLYLITSVVLLLIGVQSIFRNQLTVLCSVFDRVLGVLILVYILSTIVSIDWYSSVFGYPTRLHGGLLSALCYAGLFWLYRMCVFTQQEVVHHVWIGWISASAVAAFGLVQAWGIDAALWEQDVQARVFSTVGQPNWLAAYLVGVLGIGVWLFWGTTNRAARLCISVTAVLLMGVVVLTRSRSGILGLIVVLMIPALVFLRRVMKTRQISRWGWGLLLIPLCLLFFYRTNFGASETSFIRFAVWKGAIEIFTHYPLLGSGVETFAYAFYMYRPVELLETTEWDFLYNKAHNEFLHVLATMGIVGFVVLCWFSYKYVYFGMQEIKRSPLISQKLQIAGLLGGWVGLSVIHFFGFSTVLSGLLMVWYLVLIQRGVTPTQYQIHIKWVYILSSFAIIVGTLGIIGTVCMGYADALSARAKQAQLRGNLIETIFYQSRAVDLFPINPWYHSDAAFSYAFAARTLKQQGVDPLFIQEYESAAAQHVEQSLRYAPRNTLIVRKAAASFAELAEVDMDSYHAQLLALSERVEELAPTDVKLRMGLIEYYQMVGDTDRAQKLSAELSQLMPQIVYE